MAYKWKPSKTAKREFASKMNEIEEYCASNNISKSLSSDSYYFTYNGVEYRISNHSVEVSVSNTGERYHGNSKEYREKVFCIHASKTRLIEIHKAITSGENVNHKGEVVNE